MRFEHVAFQQGVMGVAEDVDAVIGEHMQIIFDVLPELVFARIC